MRLPVDGPVHILSSMKNRPEGGLEFTPIPDDLLRAPDELPSPPVITEPALLPCRSLTWSNFERLCVEIARTIDVAADVRLYGDPGQKQDGIDLYARLPDGRHVVYQVRDIASLTASRLRQAVADYARGRRPFGAERYVLCVACSARGTAVLDELEELREENRGNLEIDLYDQEKCSDLLRARPDVVQRFFGAAWRDALYARDSAMLRHAQPNSGPTADSLLRGPIRSLGLASELRAAEIAESSHPGEAAMRYKRIADQLDRHRFGGHANEMRKRQAKVLRTAGNLDDSFICWFEIARREAEDGLVSPYPLGLREIREFVDHLSASDQAKFAAVDGLAVWYEDPERGLEGLRAGGEALLSLADPFAARAWVWLAEASLIDGSAEQSLALIPTLDRLAAEASADDETAVRLRLAVADASGDWASLAREAGTGRLDPKRSALVHARYGRWLAWHGDPDGAVDAYHRTVVSATNADIPGDVVQALLSVNLVRQRYGPLGDEAMNGPQLARAIDGTRTCLGGRRDALRAALSALHGKSAADAQLSLRRYLWESRMGGHLQAERHAHDLLGGLYARLGLLPAGIHHLIRAGNADMTSELAGSTTKLVEVGSELDSPAPWVRATALRVLAAQADVLTPEAVHRHVPSLIRMSRGVRQSPFGAQVGLEAIRALSEMALQIPPSDVEAVLELLSNLIDREPGHYRPSDEMVPKALYFLYIAHPVHRRKVGLLLARCIGVEELAARTCMYLLGLGPAGRDLMPDLRVLARQGNRASIQVLASLNDTEPCVIAEAEQRVESLLAIEPVRGRTTWTIGGLDIHASALALLLPQNRREALARHWLRLGQDDSDLEVNRACAIDGITLLARSLPDEMCLELFDSVFALLDPAAPMSAADLFDRQTLHPLSRFRVSLGTGALPQSAIGACAALATTSEHAEVIVRSTLAWLGSSDQGRLQAAQVALTNLRPGLLPLDPQLLSSHPSSAIRQAAVLIWARNPKRDARQGWRFIADGDKAVRAELAGALRAVSLDSPQLAADLYSRLKQDESAWVRARAGLNDPREQAS